jgi:hypothetical protein
METLEFVHLTYGELVRQFGRNSSHTFASWDQLPEAEREKWVAALSVIHGQVFPHGEKELHTDRGPGVRSTSDEITARRDN